MLRPITKSDLPLKRGTKLYVGHLHAGGLVYEDGTLLEEAHLDPETNYRAVRAEAISESGIKVTSITYLQLDHLIAAKGLTLRERAETDEEYIARVYASGKRDEIDILERQHLRPFVAVLARSGDTLAYDAAFAPVYGTDINLRIFVQGDKPDEALARIRELLGDFGEVVREQARPLLDERVNVSVSYAGSDHYAMVGINVLAAEVNEFRRQYPREDVRVEQVPYRAPMPVKIRH